MITFIDKKIVRSQYYDGNTSLLLLEENGWEIYGCITVNIQSITLMPDMVILDVNNFSTYLLETLEDAGLVEQITSVKMGYVRYPIVRLTEKFLNDTENISTGKRGI